MYDRIVQWPRKSRAFEQAPTKNLTKGLQIEHLSCKPVKFAHYLP